MDYITFGVYWSLFLPLVYSFEYLLYEIKKPRIKFKIWHYSFGSKILMTVSAVFCLLGVIYQYQNIKCIYFVIVAVCALFYVYLKQKENCSDVLINYLQKDTESIGAFWAYQAYDAYYSLVLKNIRERMEVYEKKNNVQFLLKELILVVPHTCNTSKLLTDKDENIKYIDNLPEIECDQGANMNRKLKNPVYKIISNQDVFIVAEYPSSLTTLWKIQRQLSNEKFCYHRDCFIKTLKHHLEGEPCIIVEYDDNGIHQTPLSNLLISSVRKKQCDRFCVEVSY